MRSALERKRPSVAVTLAAAALVAALAALVVSMVGTATGLPGKNRIDRNDLRKRVVKAINVQKNAIRGFQVAPNSVGGLHIREGTLGTVPSAANANRVGGVAVRSVFERVSADDHTPLASVGGLDVSLDCDALSDGGLRLSFGQTPTAYRLVRIRDNSAVFTNEEANRTGGSPLIIGANDVFLLSAASGGRSLNLQLQSWNASVNALGQQSCLFAGTLMAEMG